MKYTYGNTRHEIANMTIKQTLLPLGFSWKEIDVITAVACQDTIGKVIKDELKPDQAANKIAYNAQKLRIPNKDFTDLLITHYMCDAGSYTRDAGGKQSLDGLFNFGRDTSGEPTIMEFAQYRTKGKIADLKMHL